MVLAVDTPIGALLTPVTLTAMVRAVVSVSLVPPPLSCTLKVKSELTEPLKLAAGVNWNWLPLMALIEMVAGAVTGTPPLVRVAPAGKVTSVIWTANRVLGSLMLLLGGR